MKLRDELQKHTLNLFAGDLDELRMIAPDVEPTVLVRKIIRDFIERHPRPDSEAKDLAKVEVKL